VWPESLPSAQYRSKNVYVEIHRTVILPVRIEVFTALTVKNGVFWDVTPCGSCKDRRSVRRLLVTVSVVSSSPILVTLMKEALSSSETSVFYKSNRS
jgi:hypothetical protein